MAFKTTFQKLIYKQQMEMNDFVVLSFPLESDEILQYKSDLVNHQIFINDIIERLNESLEGVEADER